MLIKKLLVGKGIIIKALLLMAFIFCNNSIARCNSVILQDFFSDKNLGNNCENAEHRCPYATKRVNGETSELVRNSTLLTYSPYEILIQWNDVPGASLVEDFRSLPILLQTDKVKVPNYYHSERGLLFKIEIYKTPWKFYKNELTVKDKVVQISSVKEGNEPSSV